MELKAGDPAPDFALPDQHGKTVKLWVRDYEGAQNMIATAEFVQ